MPGFHYVEIKSYSAASVGTTILIDGKELKGVTKASLVFDVGKPVKLTLEMIPGSLDVDCEATVQTEPE